MVGVAVAGKSVISPVLLIVQLPFTSNPPVSGICFTLPTSYRSSDFELFGSAVVTAVGNGLVTSAKTTFTEPTVVSTFTEYVPSPLAVVSEPGQMPSGF